MVKVSVIVPVYNAPVMMLMECLNSVLNQDFKDFEIVVVDDGSAEHVRKTCDMYGGKIIYHRNTTNMGIGFSRQRGVEIAQGDYICFLSADDKFHTTFLSEMVKEAERYPLHVIYCGLRICNEKFEPTATIIPREFENHEDFCVASLELAYANSISVNYSSLLAPREVFKEVPFNEELRYGEDLDHLLRAMMKFKFRALKKELVDIMVHRDSATSARFWDIPTNNKKIIRNFLGLVHE